MFSAPEIMLGLDYSEAVDVYSFGMTLIAMSVEQPILEFIGERWCSHFNKNKVTPNRMLQPIINGNWKPITAESPIPFAPITINTLIIRCCAHDPLTRPKFDEILKELEGPCKANIGNGVFYRRDAKPVTSKETEPSHMNNPLRLNTTEV